MSSYCKEPAARPVEDVAGLSAWSRRYSAQCVFRIRRASKTLNSWSSAPGIFLQPRILCRFFLCSWRRRVWLQISQRRKIGLLQRRRARYTLPRRSAPITTVPTSILCHRSQNSLFLTPHTPFLRINRVEGGQTKP